MKILFRLLCLATSVVAMAGCFQPEISADSPTVNQLVGYWEVVHIHDYDVNTNIKTGEESVFEWSSAITPNDGNEEYSVLRFTESVVIRVATDCEESKSDLNIPIPYNVSGKRLYCLFFQDPETNLKFGEIEELTDDTLVIFMDENHNSEDHKYHDTRRITFKKIQ